MIRFRLLFLESYDKAYFVKQSNNRECFTVIRQNWSLMRHRTEISEHTINCKMKAGLRSQRGSALITSDSETTSADQRCFSSDQR